MNNTERSPVENEFSLLRFFLLRSRIDHEFCSIAKIWGKNLPVVSVTDILDAIGIDLSLYNDDELNQLNYLPLQTLDSDKDGLEIVISKALWGELDEQEEEKFRNQIAWWYTPELNGSDSSISLSLGVTELFIKLPISTVPDLSNAVFAWSDEQLAYLTANTWLVDQDYIVDDFLELINVSSPVDTLVKVTKDGFTFPLMHLQKQDNTMFEEPLISTSIQGSIDDKSHVFIDIAPVNETLSLDKSEIEGYNDIVEHLYNALSHQYDDVIIVSQEYEYYQYNINSSYLLSLRFLSELNYDRNSIDLIGLDIFRKAQSKWLDGRQRLSAKQFGHFVKANGVTRIVYSNYISEYTGGFISRVYSGFNPVGKKKIEFQVDAYSDKDYKAFAKWENMLFNSIGASVDRENNHEFTWEFEPNPTHDDLLPYMVLAAPDSHQKRFSYVFLAYRCDGMFGQYDGSTSKTLNKLINTYIFKNMPRVMASPIVILPITGQTNWIDSHITKVGGIDSVNDPRYVDLLDSLMTSAAGIDEPMLGSFVMVDGGSSAVRDALMHCAMGPMPINESARKQIEKELHINNLREIISFHDLSYEEFMV